MDKKSRKLSQKKQARPASGQQAIKDTVVYRNPRGIPFPSRYRTTMRVAIQGNIVAASSGAVYKITGNNVYLPFLASSFPGVLTASTATLQPAGFTNLCSATVSQGPYNNFKVFGSSIRARMVPALSTDMVTYAVLPTNSGSIPNGLADALAEPRSKSRMTQGGASMTSITHQLDTTTFFGVGPYAISDDLTGTFSGAYNTSPTQLWYWCLVWNTSNGGTVGGAVSYEVELLYDVEFFNLNYGNLADA